MVHNVNLNLYSCTLETPLTTTLQLTVLTLLSSVQPPSPIRPGKPTARERIRSVIPDQRADGVSACASTGAVAVRPA